jgi:transcriptional regulator with XRE-family HTH domain
MKGETLQFIREELHLSRKEFGDFVGMKGDRDQIFKTISRYETDRRPVPPMLARFALLAHWAYVEHGIKILKWPTDIDEVKVDDEA